MSNKPKDFDKIRTEMWIEKVLEKFPENAEKYDYSNVVYTGSHSFVEIFCKEHEGVFQQRAYSHVQGHGCPVCEKKRAVAKATQKITRSHEEWVTILAEKNPNIEVLGRIVNGQTKVQCLCRVCGHKWSVQPRALKNGEGCPLCGRLKMAQSKTLSHEEHVAAITKVNPNIEILGEITNNFEKVPCRCAICGHEWDPIPNNLKRGSGCPKCANASVSKPEQEIADLIKSWCPDLEVQRNVRGLIPDFTVTFKKDFGGKKTVHNAELDLYIPERNLAIEYNGMYWHDKKAKGQYYHCHKRKACDAVGIRMFTIWEADWQDERKRPIIERYLKNALGVRSERTVYARKCVIKPVPQDEYRAFMNAYHVQGYASAKEAKYGLYTNDTDELVACMSFKILKNKDQKDTPFVLWDMVRYATSCNVPGGRSKLFKFLQKEFHMDHVQSFLDRDYFTGVSYRPEDGWTLEEDEQVTLDVWHPKGGRMPRQAWWHAAIPATLRKLGMDPNLYDPGLTQNENAYNAGCQFFENSGNARFEWHSEEGKADPVYQEWLAKQKRVSKE